MMKNMITDSDIYQNRKNNADPNRDIVGIKTDMAPFRANPTPELRC